RRSSAAFELPLLRRGSELANRARERRNRPDPTALSRPERGGHPFQAVPGGVRALFVKRSPAAARHAPAASARAPSASRSTSGLARIAYLCRRRARDSDLA